MIDSEGVEKPCPREQRMVSGGNNRSEDYSVDERACGFGAGHLENYGKGGGGR